jgi:hypothetical protein
LTAVCHIFVVGIEVPYKNVSVEWKSFAPGTKGDLAMNSADEWTYESIEIPASVLWKRTLLLTFVSAGIGIGIGYFMGRSVPGQEPLTVSLRRFAAQVQLTSPSDKGSEAPVRTDQSQPILSTDLPKVGTFRQTIMQIDEEPSPASIKG